MTRIFKTIAIFMLLTRVAHALEFNTLRTNQSRVDFAYKQMSVPMQGQFKRFSGQLRFDPAKPTLVKAALDINLASIDTGTT